MAKKPHRKQQRLTHERMEMVALLVPDLVAVQFPNLFPKMCAAVLSSRERAGRQVAAMREAMREVGVNTPYDATGILSMITSGHTVSLTNSALVGVFSNPEALEALLSCIYKEQVLMREAEPRGASVARVGSPSGGAQRLVAKAASGKVRGTVPARAPVRLPPPDVELIAAGERGAGTKDEVEEATLRLDQEEVQWIAGSARRELTLRLKLVRDATRPALLVGMKGLPKTLFECASLHPPGQGFHGFADAASQNRDEAKIAWPKNLTQRLDALCGWQLAIDLKAASARSRIRVLLQPGRFQRKRETPTRPA